MTFSVYIGSVYFLFFSIFFSFSFFVGWDQNLNVNILGEFSVKIGFSFLVRYLGGGGNLKRTSNGLTQL